MQIIQDRRNLHRIPELDHHLPETMAYLSRSLEDLGCRVFAPAEGSLCAWFDFGADHAIAFRSDADALPVMEKNTMDYSSCHPGKMHACGHDGHMAILLELARRLSRRNSLPHNVLLVFQCAEETTGGALEICRSGVFGEYRVEAIFGLHLWPGLEKNTFFSRKNEMMSRSSQIDVEISGKSSHIAKPAEGLDALAAGVEFYRRVRGMEQSLPENGIRLLNFGLFQSGTVCNAISGHTRMSGSLRAFRDEMFEQLRDGILAAAKAVETETGCAVAVHMTDGYPAVMNPGELYDRVKTAVEFRELDEPSMTTEDFGWYQRFLPGMFFFLGLGDVPALHSDNFDFDESALRVGADFFEELAVKFR